MIAALLAACGDDDGGSDGTKSDASVDSGTMMRMDSGPPPSGSLRDNTAGKACTKDTDCDTGMCATQIVGTALLSMPIDAPGGYCTAPCMTDAQCGAGGACLDDLNDLELFADWQCYATCASADDCRDGYTCAATTTLSGTTVSTCRPTPPTDQLEDGVVGDACAAADDCPGGTCATSTPGIMGFGSVQLPGGYCSGNCLEASHCGEGGICVAALLGGSGMCYLGCSDDDDCDRDGYRCRMVGTGGTRGCTPAADPLPDNTAGNACSDDADCGGNSGSCATQLPGAGLMGLAQMVAAPDGYCTQPCSEAADCGEDGACVFGTCYQVCADVSDCRDGYTCEMRGAGIPGATPALVCAPGMAPPPEDPDAG